MSRTPLGATSRRSPFFVAGTLLMAMIARSHRLLPHRRWWAWTFCGLFAGGMVGNQGERSLHWCATDYLSLGWGSHWLPPGNLTDLSNLLSIPLAALMIGFELEARALRGWISQAADAMANEIDDHV